MKNSITTKNFKQTTNKVVLENSHVVLKIMLYFDIFNYPLTLNEIYLFSNTSKEKIKEILSHLIQENKIFKLTNFYSLTNEIDIANRREKGNSLAKKIMKTAKKVSKFISQFPFVEAVFLSGSLSKGYFGEEDDIDYFIVTKPNRVWLSRTLLIAFKKIFLLNSKKYFCVNYFMSTNALEIKEKNRFTATEFATLIPMSGNGVYKDLQTENPWVFRLFS